MLPGYGLQVATLGGILGRLQQNWQFVQVIANLPSTLEKGFSPEISSQARLKLPS